jgi:LemA protein
MFILILVVIVVLLAFWGIGIYNRLVKNRNMMEEGYSGMDVQLKKRHDLIPNLVNTVKGYATHEQETFEKVMAARAQAMSGMSRDPQKVEQSAASQNQLTSALGRLFAVAENYPELKADANFRELQEQLSAIEGDIEKSRRYYNATVRDNNIAVESFPSSIIAGMGGFQHGVFFEMEDPTHRELPEVKF